MSVGPDEPLRSNRQFRGKITVAARIIDYLSSGLYKSPGACLKELVNNSYDADATLVSVLVKPDADHIIIEDNGRGMTLQTFERHFDRIAESHKRDDVDTTPMGRPMIGKIGIGFIAANEICEEMEIFSTVEGSSELLHVTINFLEMRQDESERRRLNHGDFAKADYYGEVLEAPESEHYTRIFLKRVRGESKDYMIGPDPLGRRLRDGSLYGRIPESVVNRLAGLDSWSSLDPYSQTMLEVALNVPVRYAEKWIPAVHRPKLRSFERAVSSLDFRVEYDGTELVKPIVLTGGRSRSLVRVIKLDGEHVGARGWMYAQHGTLRPEDINGVLIRIRNAAVGEYDDTYLGFPHTEGTLFQRWITGEIYADDGLEEALNIDRRTLREAHPAYVELKRWFHRELSDFLKEVRRDLSTSPARERQKERTRAESDRIRDVTEEIRDSYGPELGNRLADAWGPPEDERQPPGATINRKFSVSELYETVLAVARETLPPELARAFIEELTRKLRG